MVENRTKLDDMEGRSSNLRDTSFQFDVNSNKLKERYRWQKYKFYLIIGGASLLGLLVLWKILG